MMMMIIIIMIIIIIIINLCYKAECVYTNIVQTQKSNFGGFRHFPTTKSTDAVYFWNAQRAIYLNVEKRISWEGFKIEWAWSCLEHRNCPGFLGNYDPSGLGARVQSCRTLCEYLDE